MDNNILIAVITGLVQAIKMTQKVPGEYLPLIAIVLGMGFGLGLSFTFMGLIDGFVYGLSAVGLYEVIVRPIVARVTSE